MPFDFVQWANDVRRWSLDAHGPGDYTASILNHIQKELREISVTDGEDVEEWVDVVILAVNGAMRRGFTPLEIAEAMVSKLAKNKRRRWPDPSTVARGQPTEHIR